MCVTDWLPPACLCAQWLAWAAFNRRRGPCWEPRWEAPGEAFGCELRGLCRQLRRVSQEIDGSSRGRCLACRGGGGEDPPSNHLWETEVWEDNYKYSCQRRHVSIDALEWDQQRLQEASGRGRKTRHEKSVCREQLIKSLLSLYVLILFA